MIKVRGAFNAKSGKTLDVQTAFIGETTLPAAQAAMGTLLGRLLHHTVAIHGDKVDLDDLLVEVCQKALETYDELPEITKTIAESAQDINDQDDPDIDFTEWPSGDDKQTLVATLTVRSNGYIVAQANTGTKNIEFNDLPTAAAGLLGVLSAIALTGLRTPAASVDLNAALDVFKESWEVNVPAGVHCRMLALTAAHLRRISNFVHNRVGEEN